MKEYQTRSEQSGIIQHSSLHDAFLYAEKDTSVWKISWEESGDRIRLVKINNGWKYEPLV